MTEMITLFHCTSGTHKESILKNGLLLGHGKSQISDGSKPIFLSDIPYHANFGNTCFKVTIPRSWVYNTSRGEGGELNLWEFACHRNIPPECIEYHSYEEDE